MKTHSNTPSRSCGARRSSMRAIQFILVCIVVVMSSPIGVSAKLIGGQDIISPPASVVDDAANGGATNTAQQAFDERQNVVLAAGVGVDAGIVPAGTRVSSHMIFLNTVETGPGASDLNVVWTFDANVIGVMSNMNGSLEVASSPLLGAVGTVYPAAPFANRGMEGNDSYVVAGNQITVNMTVTEPGDWIRVLTEAKVEVGLDIHPTSCPNPLATRKQGVVPVAILGSGDLDVFDIDPFTIELEGVPPMKMAYSDVAGPFDGDLCGCTTDGPDGYTDLTLKFMAPLLVDQLGTVTQNEEIVLTVTGFLLDGTSFSGSDCMVIRGRVAKPTVQEMQWHTVKQLYR